MLYADDTTIINNNIIYETLFKKAVHFLDTAAKLFTNSNLTINSSKTQNIIFSFNHTSRKQ